VTAEAPQLGEVGVEAAAGGEHAQARVLVAEARE
jgi:hypothetical protein